MEKRLEEWRQQTKKKNEHESFLHELLFHDADPELFETAVCLYPEKLFPQPAYKVGLYTYALEKKNAGADELIRSFLRNPAACLTNLRHRYRLPFCRDLLAECVSRGDASSVYACLELSGADPNVVLPSGYTAAQQAILLDDHDCLRALLDHPLTEVNAVVNGCSVTSLAVYEGNTRCMRMIINHPTADLNRIHGGRSLVELVAGLKNLDTVLACPRVDVNSLDKNGRAPIHHICEDRYSEPTLKRLLRHPKTNPNLLDSNGSSPLMLAREKKRQDLVEVLLRDQRINRDDADPNSA